MKLVIQRDLRRGRMANRVGMALFWSLLLVLLVSVLRGVTSLPAC